MSRRTLAIYIWCAAVYELAIALCYRLREGSPPPVLLDPRGPLQWMFASLLGKENVFFAVASAAWLVGIGFGIMAVPRLLWIYGIVEACLALPTVVLLGTILLFGSGHIGFGPGEFVVTSLVLLAFSVIPVFVAFRLAVQGGSNP